MCKIVNTDRNNKIDRRYLSLKTINLLLFIINAYQMKRADRRHRSINEKGVEENEREMCITEGGEDNKRQYYQSNVCSQPLHTYLSNSTPSIAEPVTVPAVAPATNRPSNAPITAPVAVPTTGTTEPIAAPVPAPLRAPAAPPTIPPVFFGLFCRTTIFHAPQHI